MPWPAPARWPPRVCVRLSEYDGPGKDVVQGSCRTIVQTLKATDVASAYATAKQCVWETLGALPARLREQLDKDTIYSAMRLIELRETQCDMGATWGR